MVQPDLAFFGQKDFQSDGGDPPHGAGPEHPVDIVVVPPPSAKADGLALSSRNAYLDEMRDAGPSASARDYWPLKAAFDAGEHAAPRLIEIARDLLAGVDSIQYLELVDTQNLEPLTGQVDRTPPCAPPPTSAGPG